MKEYKVSLDIKCNSKSEALDIKRMITELGIEFGCRNLEIAICKPIIDDTYMISVQTDAKTKKKIIKYLGLTKERKGISLFVMGA